MNALIEVSNHNALPAIAAYQENVSNAVELWLAGLSSEGTRKAYRWELEQFAAFIGANITQAMSAFLRLSTGQAHAVADKWRASKIAAGKSPSSVNRSMATLNSFVDSSRRHGLTELVLKAKAEKSARYRDTSGCGLDGFHKLMTQAKSQDARKAARDAAILRLAFDLGLRRNEIASLDISHVDLAGDELRILAKGHRERIHITLSAEAKSALAAWLAVRGTDAPDAPVFVSLARDGKEGRITGRGLHDLVSKQLGEKAGIKARPHGIRHAAITAAIEATKGDIRAVQKFSRHANVQTVILYDDNRKDEGGRISTILGALTR